MMYYVEGPADFLQCWDNRLPEEARTIPDDSKVPLPPNPLLDEQAGGHHHHHGMSGDEGLEGEYVLSITIIAA